MSMFPLVAGFAFTSGIPRTPLMRFASGRNQATRVIRDIWLLAARLSFTPQDVHCRTNCNHWKEPNALDHWTHGIDGHSSQRRARKCPGLSVLPARHAVGLPRQLSIRNLPAVPSHCFRNRCVLWFEPACRIWIAAATSSTLLSGGKWSAGGVACLHAGLAGASALEWL